MSVATEISRITEARNSIRNTLIGWGKAQSSDALVDLASKLANVENKGAVEAEVQEGQTYTIPEGYHNGSGTVSGVSGGGSYNLQAKEATPTTSEQSITPDQGYYGLSAVTVGAIPTNYKDVSGTTATAADVLANKVFIAADGTTTTGTLASTAIPTSFNPLTQTSLSYDAGVTAAGTITLTNDLETALAAI